ncbi:MAG: hypothetical protein AAGJ29_11265 [Pseudomonadota bacterium]
MSRIFACIIALSIALVPVATADAPDLETRSDCTPTDMRIYFKSGETVLSAFSRNVIAQRSAALAGCKIARLDLIADAEDGRSADEAASLSEARIATVISTLQDYGLGSDTIDARQTDFERDVPGMMARRVDIRLAAYRDELS